jgi:NAD(P)-dependent dehydrogenase (short-subunit alcohol dehydrogenase family)
LRASSSLSVDLCGIRANAISPGHIRTPGTEAMYADAEVFRRED